MFTRLQDGERVLRQLRPTRRASRPVVQYLLGVILIVAGTGLYWYIGRSGVALGNLGPVLLGLAVIGGLQVAWMEIRVRFTRYYLTDRRVIREFRFIRQHNSIVPYTKITDIGPQQSIVERLAGTWNIDIETAGSASTRRPEIRLLGQPDGQEIVRLIADRIR